MDKRFIDTDTLSRLGREVRGETALSCFERLVADLPPQADSSAQWSVTGSQDALGQQFLDVHVRAAPVVQCQRCMGMMAYPVDSASRLLVVQSEDELDVEDDPDSAPEEWIEPVLASRRLDVLTLVEDELILALPYIPTHDQCATEALEKAGQADDQDDTSGPSPFAVLGQLKKD